KKGSHALHALQNLQILWIYACYFMVAIGVNQSRIGGKPYGIVLTGIDRPVRVKIQGRYECNNGVQFCACGYRESEWPSGPKGRRFKSCHLDHLKPPKMLEIRAFRGFCHISAGWDAIQKFGLFGCISGELGVKMG